MKSKDYKKINLRDFRHNLTQLKDSLADGQVYEVIEKGNPIGYFVPSQYDIKLKEKLKKPQSDKTLFEILEPMRGKFELKDEIKHFTDYKKAYHYLLDKKYNKKK